MKTRSVKRKIAGWLTLLMAAMSLLLLAFMLSISSAVVYQTASGQLAEAVHRNLSEVGMQDGKLRLGAGFVFSHSGVSTLLYSGSKALMAGQIPVSFTVDEPFENGVTRIVTTENDAYLVMDLWLAVGWDDGVWVRGLMEMPEQQGTTRNLIWVAIIALPIFIVLAALGSYRIAKRAFKPLDSIAATAAAINDAKDLSGRIALPPGQDEFSRLAGTFDAMFARLEQSFEAEKQFVADASHELRTPLSVIRGACEYAEKYDGTQQEWQESIAMIHRQAIGMSDLIAQLLNMTRLEQGMEQLRLEWLDLAALARSVCAEQGYDAQRLYVDADAKVMVKADCALLSRVIRNLLENAWKYGRPEGQVWVSVKQTETACLLSVRDDGIGIAPAQQEKIWQRFYQVDPSRGEQSGTGLGLSMVQKIVYVHGGEVELESAVGVGSCFTLHLPRAAAPE